MGFLRDFFFNKPKETQQQVRQAYVDPQAKELLEMKIGAMFMVRGYGNDMADIDVSVNRVSMFSEDRSCWYEYQGIASTGQQVYLEVDQSDTVELDISLECGLNLSDLGITKNQLATMAEEQSGELTYQGETFVYDDGGEAVYYRDCDEEFPNEFDYVAFWNEALKQTVIAKIWENGKYHFSLYQSLRPNQVEVLSSGE